MLLIHPKIHTMSPRLSTPTNPFGTVSALRILHGRVWAAGDASTLMRTRAEGEAVVRPQAGCILPGLIDTHAHVTPLTRRPVAHHLDPTQPLDALLNTLRNLGDKTPRGEWVIAEGWDQSGWESHPLLDGHGFPSAALLDTVLPHHRAYLIRKDHHAAWVNSAALHAAHITDTTPNPIGGSLLRDSAGQASGVLIDTATNLVEDLLPAPSEEDLRAHIAHTAMCFLKRGVTSVHCALVRPEHLSLCSDLFAGPNPAIPLRMRAMVFAAPDTLQKWAMENTPSLDAYGGWGVTTLKTFADGALGSRGAWMLEPYTDDPDASGAYLFSPRSTEALCHAAIPNGWQVATHAIGSRAIRETLRAYRNAAKHRDDLDAIRRLRWRIEHVQHLHPDDLDKLSTLGVYAAMQPIHATQDMEVCLQRLGPERTAHAYPWRAVLDSGIPLGLGSDYPIETLCPFAGIHAAITRQRPDTDLPDWWPTHNALTRLQAVRGYTIDAAAFSPFDQNCLGILDSGAWGDWVALQEDLAQIPVQRIPSIHILQTAQAGRVVMTHSP